MIGILLHSFHYTFIKTEKQQVEAINEKVFWHSYFKFCSCSKKKYDFCSPHLSLSGCLSLWQGGHFTKVSTAPTSFLFHYTSAVDVLHSLQSGHSRPSLLPFQTIRDWQRRKHTYLSARTHTVNTRFWPICNLEMSVWQLEQKEWELENCWKFGWKTQVFPCHRGAQTMNFMMFQMFKSFLNLKSRK